MLRRRILIDPHQAYCSGHRRGFVTLLCNVPGALTYLLIVTYVINIMKTVEATAANSSEWKSMDYLTVPSSSKLVGIALAAHVGAENITTSIGKALAARGITNVVISLIEEPSILPFLAKSLAETCDVVLAVAVLGADEKNMANLLKQQLVEAGLVCACPIIPGIMTPGNLLELKALLPACTNTWCNSVSSILAIRDGAQPIAITAIIHEDVLAKAGTVLGPVSEDVSDLDHLLTDFRESMKVPIYISDLSEMCILTTSLSNFFNLTPSLPTNQSHGARGICGIGRKFRIMDDNNSKTLDIGEFTKGVSEHTLSWNTTQIKAVFDFFDQEKNGQISYDEFLVALRGPLNERRKQFVYLAFEILDKDKNGVIETKDLVGVYDGSKHPDVIAGKKTQEDVLR